MNSWNEHGFIVLKSYFKLLDREIVWSEEELSNESKISYQ